MHPIPNNTNTKNYIQHQYPTEARDVASSHQLARVVLGAGEGELPVTAVTATRVVKGGSSAVLFRKFELSSWQFLRIWLRSSSENLWVLCNVYMLIFESLVVLLFLSLNVTRWFWSFTTNAWFVYGAGIRIMCQVWYL